MKPSSFQGLLVLDKPRGLTSRDAVDRALRWFPRGTRVGHTGTLDPLATGVLVLCVGAATRLTEYVQRMDKVYRTTWLLGARSDTDDADGTVTKVEVDCPPDLGAVRGVLGQFLGDIEQVPPTYSAAKVTGRRAYDLARRGEGAVLAARRVHVYGINLLSYDYPRLTLEVHCGKGTYVRSLARDLGEKLGCGALVETLRRPCVGPFRAEGALTLEADAATARSRLLPLAVAVVDLPHLVIPREAVARVRQGQAIRLDHDLPAGAAEVALFDEQNVLVAVAEAAGARCQLRPVKVLPPTEG